MPSATIPSSSIAGGGGGGGGRLKCLESRRFANPAPKARSRIDARRAVGLEDNEGAARWPERDGGLEPVGERTLDKGDGRNWKVRREV